MYDSYFGFAKLPFEANYEREFLFLSEGHQEVLAALVYFIKAKKAFAMVCGDVGTGKTMLIHCFLHALPESVRPIVVANPFVSSMDLLRYVARALHLPERQEGILELSDRVKEALLETRSRGEQVVLIVDEAHLLSEQSLEEIRLLSNLETPEQKLLQILLVGQHELSHKVDRPALRPLRQRININRVLSPLSPSEARQYVDHRLKKVGSSFDACFAPNCPALLYKLTGGVPRRLNQLCDNALLICMTAKVRQVSRKILLRAEEAGKTDVILIPPGPRPVLVRVLKSAIPVVAIAALLALGGISGHSSFKNEKLGQTAPPVAQENLSPREIKGAAATPPEKMVVRRIGAETAAPGADRGISARSPVNSTNQAVAPRLATFATAPVQVDQNRPGSASLTKGSDGGNQPGARPRQVVVRNGESLGAIVSRHYPDHYKMGLLAMRLANRNELKDDLIYPGQALILPKMKLAGQGMQLDDRMFFAPYGRYHSPESLSKGTNWLKKKEIKFLVLRSRDTKGKAFYQVVIGDYGQEAELEGAFLKMNNQAKPGY